MNYILDELYQSANLLTQSNHGKESMLSESKIRALEAINKQLHTIEDEITEALDKSTKLLRKRRELKHEVAIIEE